MKTFLDLLLSLFGIIDKKPKEIKPLQTPKKVPVDLDTRLYEKEAENTKKEAETLPVAPVAFKSMSGKRLKAEYAELTKHNIPLKSLIEDLNIYVNREFKKTLTITMIFRTSEEQDYLYRNSDKYKKKKFKSPHQFWCSVDLRSRNFSESQIKQLEEYLNKKWNSSNYFKWTARHHTIGAGLHLHVQYKKNL